LVSFFDADSGQRASEVRSEVEGLQEVLVDEHNVGDAASSAAHVPS
jgi:hypothetical protein